MVYAYNPIGEWTSQHQMSLNGKTDKFDNADLYQFGKFADLKKHEATRLLDQIQAARANWQAHCENAGVPEEMAQLAANGFRAF